MGLQSRETLKGFFGAGQKPTAENFKDFIESTVNILDDGFSKHKGSAIKVAPAANATEIISVLTDIKAVLPEWTISLETGGDLHISGKKSDGNKPASLLMKSNGDIELQGRNIVLSGNTQGKPEETPADGKWYTIAENLEGINVLQVVASYSNNRGRRNTLVAWASHCSGRRRKIKRIRPRTFFWNNKIRMRWIRTADANGHKTLCSLQVKTRYNAGAGGIIKCSITPLLTQSII